MGYKKNELHLLLDETVKGIWFEVPGCGERRIKKFFFQSGFTVVAAGSSVGPTSAQFRFAFVRNPWDRITTIYNKLHRQINHSKKKVQVDSGEKMWILDTFFPDISPADFTFPLFLQTVCDPKNLYEHPYWAPQSFLIPAEGLDYIGRYERFEADFRHILQALSQPPPGDFPPNRAPDFDYFKNCDPQLVSSFKKAYQQDFERFEYNQERAISEQLPQGKLESKSRIAPKKKLFLHVGPHKTASSFLQVVLYNNRKTLRKNGILYPDLFMKGVAHHRLFDLLKKQRYEGKELAQLKKSHLEVKPDLKHSPFYEEGIKINAVESDVVLSSEGFSLLEPGELNFLKELFWSFEIHIIYYYRYPSSRILSLWQETIKHGETHTYSVFRQKLFDYPSSFSFNDYQRLKQFARVFGKNNIQGVYYETATAEKRILSEFLEALGKPGIIKEPRNTVINKSLDFFRLELLRYLNMRQIKERPGLSFYFDKISNPGINPEIFDSFKRGISKSLTEITLYNRPEDTDITEKIVEEFAPCFRNSPIAIPDKIVQIPDEQWLYNVGLLATVKKIELQLLHTGASVAREEAILRLPPRDVYQVWYKYGAVPPDEIKRQQVESEKWKCRSLISIVIPVYNSNPSWLRILFSSIARQSYSCWECIIVEDGSAIRNHFSIIREFCKKDERFKLIENETNAGVSSACQQGVEAATGSYICIVDHDDILELNALYEIAKVINSAGPDVIYTDEALINRRGAIINCFLRTTYNYYRLISSPYIIHLTVYKKEVLIKAGGFDSSFTISQDYELLLRVAAQTSSFYHIPKVLYKWRVYGSSNGHKGKALVMDNSKRALNQHLSLRGFSSVEAWAENGFSFNFFRVRYKIQPLKVSIIIVEGQDEDYVLNCLESFSRLTRVPDSVKMEFLVLAPKERERDISALGLDIQFFSYTAQPLFTTFNDLAGSAKGSLLLFLGSRTEIVDPNWLEAMVELFSDKQVGAVGAQQAWFSHPSLIKSAGKILFGSSVVDDHYLFREFAANGIMNHGQGFTLYTIRETTGIDKDCLMVRKDLFQELGGFDEGYQDAFGDVDLCLRIGARGMKNLFTPYSRIGVHPPASGIPAIKVLSPDEVFFQNKWGHLYEKGDLFYNSNFCQKNNLFWPRHDVVGYDRAIRRLILWNSFKRKVHSRLMDIRRVIKR